MSLKRARKQTVAFVLTLMLAVAQFALPASAAVYDVATDAVMDAFAGYIPPMATDITLDNASITINARGTTPRGTFTLSGAATGPITYTRNNLPSWIELTVNDTAGTVVVNFASAGVPPNSVSANHTIQIHRGGYTTNATITLALPNQFNFTPTTVNLTARDSSVLVSTTGSAMGGITFVDRAGLPDWVTFTLGSGNPVQFFTVHINQATIPTTAQNFTGTVYVQRAAISGGGRILLTVNVDIPYYGFVPPLTTPSAPAAFSLSYDETDPGVEFTVTIPETAGAEYSFDGGTTWGAGRTITAQPGDVVTGYKRIAAVAGVSYASAATYASVTIPAFYVPALTTPAAPAAFALTYDETDPGVEFTVTIPETAGAEYSFDGGTTWGAERTTTAQPGDVVTGYKRIAAVAGVSYASAATYATVTIPAFGTTPPPPPQQVETPTATPNGGTFTDNVSVTLETVTPYAEIFFTIDGTAPDSSSTLFDTPIVLTDTTTIRAIAIATGMDDSEVLEVTFTRQAPPQDGGNQTGPPPGWQPPTGGGGSNVIPSPPVTPPDTGTTPPDTDTTPPDAGTTPPDAGTTPPDAGTTPPDTGTTPPDTGVTPPITGTTPPGTNMGAVVNAPAGVNVVVPPALAGIAAPGTEVAVNVATQPAPAAGLGGMAVTFSVEVGGAPVATLPARIEVSIPLENISTAVNHHRIVAFAADGTILGGSFDRASGEFILETDFAGDFTIAYVENLTRLLVQMDSFIILDLADNATVQVMDVLPTVVSGRTLLPARFVAQALGGTASWNSATRQSTITVGGASVTLREGEIAPGMDVPVQVIDGRTMVPARFISETFGAVVRWDSATQSFEIIM